MCAGSRKVQPLFATEDVHQQYDALLAVVGHQDPLKFRERILLDTDALAWQIPDAPDSQARAAPRAVCTG
jgi:hypothetical protein